MRLWGAMYCSVPHPGFADDGTDSDTIRVVEESLRGMKKKLAVAEAAAIQARLNESFVGEFARSIAD